MATIRKPFQGVGNIIRFNWHFYLIALLIMVILMLAAYFQDGLAAKICSSLALLVLLTSLFSLAVSWYLYDVSGLFKLYWLDKIFDPNVQNIVNINAGFDEFSGLIQQKYPNTRLKVFDFYNALERKEISIQRAQNRYAPYSSTESIGLRKPPLNNASCEIILLLLAAHEIRNDKERIDFFKELRNALHPSGKIIVVEHVRDACNFLAYTIGFFHFLSRNKWIETFSKAGFIVSSKNKITPFLTVFILQKDGNSL